MQDRETVCKYLDQVLDSDPLVEAPAIVGARNAFLGIQETTQSSTASYEDALEEREELRAALRALQEELPTLDEAAALRRLETLDSKAHPDLAAWQTRLRRFAETAEFRAEIGTDTNVTQRVLDGFVEIATSPEEEATVLRSRQLAKLSGPLAVQSAKRIKKQYPELYDLEADWFERILSLKRDKKLSSSPAVFGTAFIVIWVVLRIVRALTRGD